MSRSSILYRALLLFFFFASGLALHAKPQFNFSKNGKLVQKLDLEAMRKLVGEVELETVEPHNGETLTYVGFDFDQLLSAVYGEEWKKPKTMNFTCSDGYNPRIDPKLFQNRDAYLVYAIKGRDDFVLVKNNEDGKKVDMSPFYLTWDIKDAPELNNVNNRPYQLIAIDLIL